MITAFVRTQSLKHIVESLKDVGISGMSISEVRGVGEQIELFNPYTVHNMLQIIVPDDAVDGVTEIILGYAHTGLAGDGLIAVLPVDHIVQIRTKARES